MQKLLKVGDVKDRLNISRDKVLQLIDAGQLTATRFGPRTIRVFEDSLKELIDGGIMK